MKHAFSKLMGFAIALSAMVACTEYPDEWGYYVEDRGTDASIIDASPEGYTIKVTNAINVVDEGTGIDGMRIVLGKYSYPLDDDVEFTATTMRQDDLAISTAELSPLEYGVTYTIRCYVVGKDCDTYIGETRCYQAIEDYYPKFPGNTTPSYTIEEGHFLKIVAALAGSGYAKAKTAEMTLLGQKQQATISDDGTRATARFDMNTIDMSAAIQNRYDQHLTIKLFNDFGEAQNTWSLYNFAYTLYPAGNMYCTLGIDEDLKLCVDAIATLKE